MRLGSLEDEFLGGIYATGLKQSPKEYFSRFHFKFSPIADIRDSKATTSHLLLSAF